MAIKDWQWLKETPVAILEENELPAWKTPGQVRQAVTAMGARLLRYSAIRWGVHTYDTSAYLPKYPDLDERDLFGEIFAEMSAHDIKVMAYCHYGVLHTRAAQLHPEWIGREKDGSQARWNGADHHYRACLCNNAFLGAMQNAIVELCGKYSFAALYLDGPCWYGDCYCDCCRAEYEKRYNEKMPRELSFADGSQQKYNIIRDEQNVNILKNLRRALVSYPRLPVLFNMTLRYLPTHRTGLPEKTAVWTQGGNTTEVHRPGNFWDMCQSIRMGSSLGKVSMGYLPPGPYETLRNFDSPEIDTFGNLYLMHGATPMLGTVSAFLNDQTAAPGLSRIVKKFSGHPQIYHHCQPFEEVGLVYSRTAAESHARADETKIQQPFSGAFRALLHEHIHFSVLFDSQLEYERIRNFRVIYIPYGAALTSQALETLKKYTAEGGNLLTGGRFTLHDERGRHLENFCAADLLGVDFIEETRPDHYRGREYRETGPRHGYSLIPEAYLRLRDPRLQSCAGGANNLLPASDAVVGIPAMKRHIEYFIVKARSTTQVLADLYLPAGGAFGDDLQFPLGTPPGITLNHYGKGKVIYIAAALEEQYFLRRLPETRRLLARLIRILLDEKSLLQLDAPSGVVMNITKNSESIFLHLLNYCGVMHEDGVAVEWIAPVRGIQVQFSARCGSVKNLRRLEDGLLVEPDSQGNFSLPELQSFATYELITGQRTVK